MAIPPGGPRKGREDNRDLVWRRAHAVRAAPSLPPPLLPSSLTQSSLCLRRRASGVVRRMLLSRPLPTTPMHDACSVTDRLPLPLIRASGPPLPLPSLPLRARRHVFGRGRHAPPGNRFLCFSALPLPRFSPSSQFSPLDTSACYLTRPFTPPLLLTPAHGPTEVVGSSFLPCDKSCAMGVARARTRNSESFGPFGLSPLALPFAFSLSFPPSAPPSSLRRMKCFSTPNFLFHSGRRRCKEALTPTPGG